MAERDMYAIATEYATLLGCGSPHGSHRVVLPATWYEDVLTISRGLRNARDDLSFLRGLRDDALATRGEIEALDEQHRAALAELERTRAVVEKAEARNRLLLDFALYITNHCPCRGMGYWFAGCRLCGDSTFDHECVYQRMECETKACEAARETLAAHKEEAVRAMRAQAKEETRE